MSDDYKAQFTAAVDELWASDLNARIGELNAEIRRLEAECRYWERTNDWLGAAKPMGMLIDKRLQQWDLVEEKIRRVDELIESYIASTGERPDSRQLDRLATWLLKGIEGDGILTYNQLKKRREREIPYEYIEYRDNDGNRRIAPKPTDSDGGYQYQQRIFVRLPHDNADLREFNGHVRKYRLME